MSPTAKKTASRESAPGGPLPPLRVPVHCCGDRCASTTVFVLVSEGAGYEGGLFEDPGWTIGTGEDFDDSGGSFICRACFERERDSGRVTRD